MHSSLPHAASTVASSPLYVSFPLTLAGVASSAFADPAVTNALIDAILYHALLRGIINLSHAQVTVLTVNDTSLSSACTLQVRLLALPLRFAACLQSSGDRYPRLELGSRI